MNQALIFTVTIFGIFLSLFSFVVIFRGQRVPGDTGSTQEIEFMGFKAKTNTMITLLIISALPAVLPLSLEAWLRSQELQSAACPAPVAGGEDVFIIGSVLDDHGNQLKGKATVSITKQAKPGEPTKAIETKDTDVNGGFDFPPLPLGPNDRYKVTATAPGLEGTPVSLGPGRSVQVRLVMLKSVGGE